MAITQVDPAIISITTTKRITEYGTIPVWKTEETWETLEACLLSRTGYQWLSYFGICKPKMEHINFI